MKIWEAIIYAIIGGITKLMPISFSGHSILIQNTFHLSSLYNGDGLFVRAGISLGIFIALYMVFYKEAKEYKLIMRNLKNGDSRRRRVQREERELNTRFLLLTMIGFIPMLLSLIFLGKAEGINKLTYITAFFVLNGLVILLCTRRPAGKIDGWHTNLFDALWIALARIFAVFPGLSSVGASICIGRARGLDDTVNFRLTYMITLAFELVSVIYYLLRGFIVGSFYGRTILSFLIAVPVSTVASLLALVTMRNILAQNKLRSFMYYCFDAAAIAFIIAIING